MDSDRAFRLPAHAASYFACTSCGRIVSSETFYSRERVREHYVASFLSTSIASTYATVLRDSCLRNNLVNAHVMQKYLLSNFVYYPNLKYVVDSFSVIGSIALNKYLADNPSISIGVASTLSYDVNDLQYETLSTFTVPCCISCNNVQTPWKAAYRTFDALLLDCMDAMEKNDRGISVPPNEFAAVRRYFTVGRIPLVAVVYTVLRDVKYLSAPSAEVPLLRGKFTIHLVVQIIAVSVAHSVLKNGDCGVDILMRYVSTLLWHLLIGSLLEQESFNEPVPFIVSARHILVKNILFMREFVDGAVGLLKFRFDTVGEFFVGLCGVMAFIREFGRKINQVLMMDWMSGGLLYYPEASKSLENALEDWRGLNTDLGIGGVFVSGSRGSSAVAPVSAAPVPVAPAAAASGASVPVSGGVPPQRNLSGVWGLYQSFTAWWRSMTQSQNGPVGPVDVHFFTSTLLYCTSVFIASNTPVWERGGDNIVVRTDDYYFAARLFMDKDDVATYSGMLSHGCYFYLRYSCSLRMKEALSNKLGVNIGELRAGVLTRDTDDVMHIIAALNVLEQTNLPVQPGAA
jgi:hypothetical protein